MSITFDIVIQFEVAFFSEPSGSGCLVLPVLAIIIEIFLPFRCSVDDGFPPVSFHFGKSLNLTVYPHDYLFPFVSILLILLNRQLSIYPSLLSFFCLETQDVLHKYWHIYLFLLKVNFSSSEFTHC